MLYCTHVTFSVFSHTGLLATHTNAIMAAKGKENFIDNINMIDIMIEERWKGHQMQKQKADIWHLWFEIQDIVGPVKLWPHWCASCSRLKG